MCGVSLWAVESAWEYRNKGVGAWHTFGFGIGVRMVKRTYEMSAWLTLGFSYGCQS